MDRVRNVDRMTLRNAVEYQWVTDEEYRLEWTLYMRRNARSRDYPDWYGRGGAWLPTTFHARFGNRTRYEEPA